MPSHRHHEPGNLLVKLIVKFPDHINPESIPLLERALPPRKPIEKFPKNIALEDVDLEEMDARQREQMEREDAMDEDADGQPRVQCANQ
jgi:DnaJ homolog subfamily A member 2